MKILKYIISISFLVGLTQVSAQEVVRDYKPSEIQIATDVFGLGKTLFTDEVKTEFQAKIDFHHFYLAGDFGINNISTTGEGFDYSSEGTFYRVGPQVNMMPYNKDRSSIFFGLMYASSSFEDHIDYFQAGEGWNDLDASYDNPNLKAHWFEMNLGINARVLGPLYLGYTVRFKFAKSLSGYDELFPLEIPGYGSADKGTRFGFNYYLIYKLRYRDKPIQKKPIKAEKIRPN